MMSALLYALADVLRILRTVPSYALSGLPLFPIILNHTLTLQPICISVDCSSEMSMHASRSASNLSIFVLFCTVCVCQFFT